MVLLANRVSAKRPPEKSTSTASADENSFTRSKMSPACSLVSIRLHQDAAVGRGNQLFQAQRLLTRQQADVRHADHRQPIPPFGAHRATRAVQPNVVRRLPRTQVSGKKPLRNDRNALRGYAFIIESKRTQAGPMLLPGIGDYIHQIASITQRTQLLERQKRSSRKVRFHSQHAIQFDGMSDGLMDLQAQL